MHAELARDDAHRLDQIGVVRQNRRDIEFAPERVTRKVHTQIHVRALFLRPPADSAVAIAASYAAKVFGIKTGTLVREARRLCPDVIPVRANHRLYTDYHERILKAVDTCMPVEKVSRSTKWPAV